MVDVYIPLGAARQHIVACVEVDLVPAGEIVLARGAVAVGSVGELELCRCGLLRSAVSVRAASRLEAGEECGVWWEGRRMAVKLT